MPKKPKLPKRTDGGCHVPFVGTIVCKPTTTGILKASHMKLVGKGNVEIPARMARAITKYIEELPADCPLVYQEEVTELVKNQLCSWCDGSGWQPVNCMENVVACPNCEGDGLEPKKTRKKLAPLSWKTMDRMREIRGYSHGGASDAWIANKLGITKVRVKTLAKLAEERGWPKVK